MSPTQIFLQILMIFISCQLSISSSTYNVLDFGAKPDGVSDSTQSFHSAWDAACKSEGDTATISVPSGKYALKRGEFSGESCKGKSIIIELASDAILIADNDSEVVGGKNWLLFDRTDGLTITGGVIDAEALTKEFYFDDHDNDVNKARTLAIRNSNNVRITGLTTFNSQRSHITINRCQGVTFTNVNISAPKNSKDTEGIHVEESSYVNILGGHIGTGDDCISVGAGSTHLWIEQIHCGPGHGISIGSLGKDSHESGVKNVTVKNCTLTETTNGARIKTWPRPSDGFAEDIHFLDIILDNVKNPIIIDQNYCPNDSDCPGQESGVAIRDVTYQGIRGTSSEELAVKFDCSKDVPCTGIKLTDINIKFGTKEAKASCNNAKGTSSGEVSPPSCLSSETESFDYAWF